MYGARPSFSSSLNMSHHLSSMCTSEVKALQFHHGLDLGYTSSLGRKRAHLMLMDTDMQGNTQCH